jgi:hypothetical protein
MDVQIACLCPPKAGGAPRHDHDTVTLPDVLDFRRTVTVRQNVRMALAGGPTGLAEMMGVLLETYVLNCIDAWSLVGADDKPIPPTRANVAAILLPAVDEAEKVGDAADDLYTEKVVLPLVVRASSSSPPTPTPEPTSPTTSGSPTRKPRKLSKPSSTGSSPMGVTGPMAASPGGASSFSPS